MNDLMAHESYPDTHHDIYSKTLFGFWLYLLTDFILFASLFATYAVLRTGTYAGASGRELFDIHSAFIQTLLLLTASFTSGLAGACAHRKKKQWTIYLFALTFVLGASFLLIQYGEFARYIQSANSWKASAFLSAFFSLVATHSIHLIFALLWIIVLLIPLIYQGVTSTAIRRLSCLRMFWQFLNIVWVFIFAIVYCLSLS